MTDDERVSERVLYVAAEVAEEYVKRAAKLLLATWPDGSDMHTIGKRLAEQAVAIAADKRWQSRAATPYITAAEERVWQMRHVKDGVIELQPNWRPTVFIERPGPAATIELPAVEIEDEAPTEEWLIPPQIDPPPSRSWRQRRRALREANYL